MKIVGMNAANVANEEKQGGNGGFVKCCKIGGCERCG